MGCTFRIRLACCTLPPTRIRCGVAALGASLTGGGGGGAAVGTLPIIPIPPRAPPATPPTTPPTTPALEGGGSSSSLIMAISFGIAFGAMSLPAPNSRGITLTTLGGAGGDGGGGGGGG